MIIRKDEWPNIATLSAASGIKRSEISTLIKAFGIAVRSAGNHVLVPPSSLPALVSVMRMYPGCDPEFGIADYRHGRPAGPSRVPEMEPKTEPGSVEDGLAGLNLDVCPTINMLAEASGIKRWKVSTLIEEHGIATRKSGNHVIVLPEGLARLIAIIGRFPGCKPDFLRSLGVDASPPLQGGPGLPETRDEPVSRAQPEAVVVFRVGKNGKLRRADKEKGMNCGALPARARPDEGLP
ncbi:hypothetical protein [Singulisphaera sp. PoT]|uniref:hypothetical protein n=1 Tax=Singulisphaera sp. PoT TaxID=3411797 RepID=UPI003BF5F2F1